MIMSEPVWLLSFRERLRFVDLPQAREQMSTATGQPARQTTLDLRARRQETRAADKMRTDRQEDTTVL